MKKRCVINLATDGYSNGRARLAETLNDKWGGDLLLFTDTQTLGCPPHHDNPYAFKVYAFKEAIRRGYESVLWLDASVYCERDPSSVFDHIEQHGYIMQEAGHSVGTWTNDKTLEHYGLDRDAALGISMYGNAGFLGLSAHSPQAMEFLRQWDEAQAAGLFKGRWDNSAGTESSDPRCKGHRHDMCCGSIIAHRLGMNTKPQVSRRKTLRSSSADKVFLNPNL
jgi:hypothetical protein